MSGTRRRRGQTLLCLLAACALAVAGCGGEDESASTEATPGQAADTKSEPKPKPDPKPATAPSAQPSPSYTEADLEFKLASLDAGGIVDGNDPILDEYAMALDSLETKCKEQRTLLGDYAEKANELLGKSGDDESRLSIMRHVSKSVPSAAPKMPCSDVFAAYVTLRQGP
jgi:hypothetical protein